MLMENVHFEFPKDSFMSIKLILMHYALQYPAVMTKDIVYGDIFHCPIFRFGFLAIFTIKSPQIPKNINDNRKIMVFCVIITSKNILIDSHFGRWRLILH